MSNEIEQAINNLSALILEQREKGDQEGLQESLLRIGNLYLNQGDAPKGLTHIEEALDLAQQNNDQISEARLWGLKGMALNKIGNRKQAIQAFNKSRRIAEKIDHLPITIDAYTQAGKLQFESGEIEKGVKDLEKGHRLAFESQDVQREMYIAGVMGNAFLMMEQAGKAMEFYSIALDAAKKLEKQELQSQYQIAIGHIYVNKEDFGPAEEHFKNALDIGARLKNRHIEFAAFESLLQLSIAQGDLAMVRFNGEQAIRLAKENEDIGAEAENIKRLCAFLFEQEQHEQAIAFLERGLELALQVHDKAEQLDAIAQLGLAHYFAGDLEVAEEDLMKAYELATQMQKAVELAQIGGKLSVVKADKGDYEEAIKYGEEAIQIARAQNLPELEGEQLVILALNYLEVGKDSKAEQQAQSAVKLYSELGRADLLEQAQALLESIRTAS